MIQQKNTILKRLVYGFTILTLVIASLPSTALAGQITPRKVTLGSSVASASTTYSFVFSVPSATVLQSVDFAACTTASGACTPAPGFSSAASTLTGQPTNLGDASGWTVNVATTTSLRLSKSGNVAAPTGTITVGFSGVVNPSATNSTFFMRTTTYSNANWTGAVDTGVAAASTAGQITVTTSVDEALTFTLTAATVTLPTLTTSSTGTGTSTMTASTNAASGYSITVSGNTLTGPTTITAMSGAASSQNSKQFGINLMANATPSVGTAVSGPGTATPVGAYASANSFKFLSGDTVASVGVPSNSNTFTTSYIANIDGSTPAGSYSTVLTYNATANF